MNPTPPSKTTLITGASSGIGYALAEHFARDGYDLVLAARGLAKMQVLAADLQRRYPIQVTVLAADLQTPEGPARLHAEVQARGIRLHTLVNNAGFGNFGAFQDADLAREQAVVQLNVQALVALTRLFLPDLVASRGKLLNVASTAAFQPGPYMAVYCASKAFVLSFTEAIAAELAPSGVSVTALCPGATASGFQDAAAMHSSALVQGKKLPSAEAVAAAGYAALQRGQRVYIPGAMNWILAQSVRLTPRNWTTAMAKLFIQPTH